MVLGLISSSDEAVLKILVDSSTIIAGVAAVLTLLLSLWLLYRDRLAVRCSAFFRRTRGSYKEAKLQIVTGRNGAKIRSIRLFEYKSRFDPIFDLGRREVSKELATAKIVTGGLYIEQNDARVVLHRLSKQLEQPAAEGRLWFHVNTSIGKRRCRISRDEMPALRMGLRK